MTEKGSYEVSDVRPSKDGSFRSMICAMLIFLAICVIIILVSTLLKPTTTKLDEKSSLSKSIGEETKIYPKDETTTTEITKTSTQKQTSTPGVTKSSTQEQTTTPGIKDTKSTMLETSTQGQTTTPETTKTSTQGQTTTPEVMKTSTQGQTTTPKVTKSSTQTQTTTPEKTQTSTQEETTTSGITETEPSSTQGQTTTPKITKTLKLEQTTTPETTKTSTQGHTTTPETTKTSTQGHTTTPEITKTETTTLKTSTQRQTTTPEVTKTSTQTQTTTPEITQTTTQGHTTTPEIRKTETTTLKTSTQRQTTTPEVTKTSTQTPSTTPKITQTSTQEGTTTPKITQTSTQEGTTTPKITQTSTQEGTTTPEITGTEPSSTQGQTTTPKITKTSTVGQTITPETTITSTLGQTTTPGITKTEATTLKSSTQGQTTTLKVTKTSTQTQTTTPEITQTSTQGLTTTPKITKTETTTLKTSTQRQTTTPKITQTATQEETTTSEITGTEPSSTQGQTTTPKITKTETTTLKTSTQRQTTTPKITQTATQGQTTTPKITKTSTVGQPITPETTITSKLGQTTTPKITKTETTTLKTSTQGPTTTLKVTKTSTQTQTTTPEITQTSTQEETTAPEITETEPSSTQGQTTTPKITKTSTVGQPITPETTITSTLGQTTTAETRKTSTLGQTTTPKITKTETTTLKTSTQGQTTTPKITKTSTVGQTITPETTITSTLGQTTTAETTKASTLGQTTTAETTKTSTLGQTTTADTTKTSTQAPEARSYTSMASAPEGESFGSENENLSSEELIDDNLCTTPTCKTFSSQILAQINHHVDKCDGFYDYTCGGFQLESTEEKIWRKIGEQVENITSDSSPNLRLFRDYYDKCLNHHILYMNERIDEAKNILHSIIPSTLSTTNEDITKLLATLMLNDYAPLFDISVDISKETKLFEFQLTLGRESTLLENENYVSQSQKKCMIDMKGNIASLEKVNFNYEYKLYRKCMNHVDEYINNVVQTVKDFDLLKDKIDFKSKFTRFINEFMDLPPLEQRTELIMKNYELKSISELNAEYPFINWAQLFSHLMGRDVDVKVQVYFGAFLKDWFKHLDTIPKKDLAEILHAMFAYNLYRTFVLPTTTSISETEKLCLKQTSKLLKEVSSSMYLHAIEDMDIEPRINEINDILSILKDSFKKSLETAKWLPEDSKVFEKLDNMKLITNMAIWKNESIIQGRMYIDPSNSKTYQSFSFELVRRYRRMIYKMWNEPADDPEYIWWFYQTVYSEEFVPIYALNKIAISPVKLLEVPKNIPEYIRLTKLYYLLAKAMGHHFDHTGIKYDVDLDLDSQIAYEQLRDCSSRKIRQDQTIIFNGKILEYEVPDSQALLSINNRIAEDIALKLTYDLSVKHLLFGKKMVWLSSTFKPVDITFITIAQEHCKKLSTEDIIIQLFESEEVPAPILLKIILPNLQTFEDVFKCPDGSTMDDYELCPAFQDLEKPEEKK